MTNDSPRIQFLHLAPEQSGNTTRLPAPFVVFDFDGTLSRVRERGANLEEKREIVWSDFMSTAFLRALHGRGLYDQAEFRTQNELVDRLLAGDLPYEDWASAWAASWARGLKGRKEADVREAAREFFWRFKADVFPQAKGVVELMRSNGLDTVLTSTGVAELVEQAQKYLGCRESVATRCLVKEGRYTGDLAEPQSGPQPPLGQGARIERLGDDKTAMPIAARLAKSALRHIDLAKLTASGWNKQLAAVIDHTKLEPETGAEEIDRLCEEAVVYGARAVCIVPEWAQTAATLLAGTKTRIAVVVGFPMGTGETAVKMLEANKVKGIASEIDMVAHTNRIKEGFAEQARGQEAKAWEDYYDDIFLTLVASGRPGKVILQTELLRDRKIEVPDGQEVPKGYRRATPKDLQEGDAAVFQASKIAARALAAVAESHGWDFAGYLKTSDGVYCKASLRDAKVMVQAVDAVRGEREASGLRRLDIGIKIAGGVRSPEQAAEYNRVAPGCIFGTSGMVGLVTTGKGGAGY